MTKNRLIFSICLISLLMIFSGCTSSENNIKVIRVAHNQGDKHPVNLALEEFEKIIETKAGDRYDIQVYPNELLGGQREALELTQTGAIDISVASISLLESFNKAYSVFNLPYLFDNSQHYYDVMDDDGIMQEIYNSTKKSGFVGLTWFDAGSRNMYTTDKPIMTPDDLKGKKIRVQQSNTNIRMIELLGGSPTPMGFGEVYTALQQNVIDGAENNELALTNNKHGEVAQFYSYNQHSMIPDILVMNSKLLDDMNEQDRQMFLDAADTINKFEREKWGEKVEEAIKQAKEMGVQFFYPDIEPFKQKVLPLHDELTQDLEIKKVYDKIQNKVNKKDK